MNQRYHRILLLWYQEEDNFGDVLIFKTVSERLLAAGLEVESHEVGDRCDRIFEHANKCDFLLFAGGGIIERYVPNIITSFELEFDQLKVPYGVMGFGMGTFDYSKYKHAIAFWVREAAFFYVRDEATETWLNQAAGVKKVKFTGDCVFGNEYLSQIAGRVGENRGVNIRDLPYKDLTGDFNWTELTGVLKNSGCNIFIPDSSHEMERLKMSFQNQEFLQRYPSMERELKVNGVIAEIRKCRWIFAMRFHVVLVSAMFGIVPIPLLYCPKVKYLSQQLGIPELALEIHEYSQLPQKVALAECNRNFYQKTLEKNVRILRERVNDMFIDVLAFLHNGRV